MSEIETLVLAELERRMPKTQDDCCAIAAKVAVTIHGTPTDNADLINRAAGMAQGLFGPAYAKTDEVQKGLWIDMCERALRAHS